MRKWCLTNNYTLNEHGLYHLVNKKKANKVEHNFKTEEDIFNYFGIDYVEPNKRIKFNSI
jgi:DNA polymerase/3'-5' exonuclease PolX